MISMTQSLLRAQRSRSILGKNLLVRVVLTYGANEYTYTTTKIKQLTYTRQAFSSRIQLLLDDTDKTLHSLDLEGYKAVFSRGLVTKGGPEWIPMAPLWVVGQQRDSYRDKLECSLSLEGAFDRMAKHKATDTYTPTSTDTRTTKDWLKEIISLTDTSSESTEEQTTSDSYAKLYTGQMAFTGQRLTISDRRVTKLAFKLKKAGAVAILTSGEVSFRIYEVDSDAPTTNGQLLAEKVWGDAGSLGLTGEWQEVTFDTPVQIDGEVRIVVYFQGTVSDADNYVAVAYNSSSVKSSEVLTELNTGLTWTDQADRDVAYKYTYSGTPITAYDDYPAYGLVFDSEDDLLDVFTPTDSIRINLEDTRLGVVRDLLGFTKCVAREGNDGLIHIFNPTTTGTTYDNEYTLVYGRDNHNFFNKRFRRRVLSPNYITFKNSPAHEDAFTGFAKDDSADLTDMREYETIYVRPVSNAQCTLLAAAYLLKLQMRDEIGAAVLPFLHFGQELYDYTNIVDDRAGDSRAGNIGFITEHYQPGQFNMHFGFGRAPVGIASLRGLASETGVGSGEEIVHTPNSNARLIEDLRDWIAQLTSIQQIQQSETWTIEDHNRFRRGLRAYATFERLDVTERIRIPVGTDKYR